MGKERGRQPRNPTRERVVGVTLVYINIVVVLFVLCAFVSIDPTAGIVEDLSWGYLDDHRFTLNDTVYTDWCNKFFEPEQCEAPIKMSGYFALRSAKVTYRAWDQFHGNFSLSPTTITIKYSTEQTKCVLPFGDVCDDCDSYATTAAAFTLLLLIIEFFVLIDQLRDVSGRVIAESEDHRAKGVYVGAYTAAFICAIIAYTTMKYGCLMKVPMMLTTGPMSILMIAVVAATVVQLFLEMIWLNATRPSNNVSPQSDGGKSSETWKKPPTRQVAAPADDPFAFDSRSLRKEPSSPVVQSHHAAAPNKPDFYDPFEARQQSAEQGGEGGGPPKVKGFNARSPPPFVPTQHGRSPSDLNADE